MKKTLQKLNTLVASGIINEYAIAGGMAQFYYVEPSVTYDLDLIVNISNKENDLAPFASLYKWAAENDYQTEGEHILIEGMPVQFLLPYNSLVAEALENRIQISLFEEKTFILSAEYLMAIMLQTWRPTDRERLVRFFDEAVFDEIKFLDIIKRFDLLNKYQDLMKKFYE